MVGTEHEKFAYTFSKNKNKYIPLSYDGKIGIKSFLKEISKFGWEPIYEEKNIIALKKTPINYIRAWWTNRIIRCTIKKFT